MRDRVGRADGPESCAVARGAGRVPRARPVADDEETAERLLGGLRRLKAAAASLPRPQQVALPEPKELELEQAIRPRDAFFGEAEHVPARDAVGRITAEQITPYPPGIPALVPGERINHPVLDYLLSGLEAGMVLPDPADPSLETIRVHVDHN